MNFQTVLEVGICMIRVEVSATKSREEFIELRLR